MKSDEFFRIGCSMCDYSGVSHSCAESTEPCEFCVGNIVTVNDYIDNNNDLWLDGVEKHKAKYSGGQRNIGSINCIVVHRMSRGRGESGPRYVSSKHLDRQVSWHATIHNKFFMSESRSISQHLPLDQVSWNAGNRKINLRSISVEFDAAMDFNPHSAYDDESIQTFIDFAIACKKLCPMVQYIIGHNDIVPKRRVDPGRRFPWDLVCERTGLERVEHENLSSLY